MPRVNIEGVGTVNFPDSMSPDEIRAAIERDILPKKARQARPEPPIDPTEGMSWGEKALAGTGKAFSDIGLAVGDMLGLVGDKTIADARERDAALMATGGGLTGNIVGNLVASLIPGGAGAAALRGAATLPALANAGRAFAAAHPLLAAAAPGAASGAVMGALEPTIEGESRLGNMATAAAIGGSVAAAGRGVARVVRPNTSDDVAKLLAEDVRLTPGQAIGGWAKASEEKLSSVPILGDIIKGAQRRGLEDYNRAAFNRALAPIGKRVGRDFKPGREAVGRVEEMIGDAYDAALDKIKRVDFDATFRSEIAQLRQMAAADLGEANARQFNEILTSQLFRRMTPAGTMSADTMKIVESELGRRARGFAGSPGFNDRQLGSALREVQAALRRATERSSPAGAPDLAAANKAWAEFVRIQDAAGRVGAKDGVFSPAQLTSAVRKGDQSVRKGAFARGDALGQDLADAGKNVLTQEVPDSGTAGRLMAALVAGGGPVGLIDPTIASLTAAASLPYTSLGGRLTLAALAKRPQGAESLADLLRAWAPAGGLVGAGLAPNLTGP